MARQTSHSDYRIRLQPVFHGFPSDEDQNPVLSEQPEKNAGSEQVQSSKITGPSKPPVQIRYPTFYKRKKARPESQAEPASAHLGQTGKKGFHGNSSHSPEHVNEWKRANVQPADKNQRQYPNQQMDQNRQISQNQRSAQMPSNQGMPFHSNDIRPSVNSGTINTRNRQSQLPPFTQQPQNNKTTQSNQWLVHQEPASPQNNQTVTGSRQASHVQPPQNQKPYPPMQNGSAHHQNQPIQNLPANMTSRHASGPLSNPRDSRQDDPSSPQFSQQPIRNQKKVGPIQVHQKQSAPIQNHPSQQKSSTKQSPGQQPPNSVRQWMNRIYSKGRTNGQARGLPILEPQKKPDPFHQGLPANHSSTERNLLSVQGSLFHQQEIPLGHITSKLLANPTDLQPAQTSPEPVDPSSHEVPSALSNPPDVSESGQNGKQKIYDAAESLLRQVDSWLEEQKEPVDADDPAVIPMEAENSASKETPKESDHSKDSETAPKLELPKEPGNLIGNSAEEAVYRDDSHRQPAVQEKSARLPSWLKRELNHFQFPEAKDEDPFYDPDEEDPKTYIPTRERIQNDKKFLESHPDLLEVIVQQKRQLSSLQAMSKPVVKDEELEFTPSQKAAYEAILLGRNVFLSGEAGTGKSFVIQQAAKVWKKSQRKVAFTASTGIAALQIHGQTVHSFFHVPPSLEKTKFAAPAELPDALQAVDTIVIDEISMIRVDVFDYISRLIERENKRRFEESQVFRKIQVIVVGDFFQIPPVVGKQDIEAFSHFYPDISAQESFAFLSPYWEKMKFQTCFLTEVVRQPDPVLLQYLNRIRIGDSSAIPYFNQGAFRDRDASKAYIRMCGTRLEANLYNKENLEKLAGETFTYFGMFIERFPKNAAPVPIALKLKIGARVMITRNDPQRRFVNGTLGVIISLPKPVRTKVKTIIHPPADEIYHAPLPIGLKESEETNFNSLSVHSMDISEFLTGKEESLQDSEEQVLLKENVLDATEFISQAESQAFITPNALSATADLHDQKSGLSEDEPTKRTDGPALESNNFDNSNDIDAIENQSEALHTLPIPTDPIETDPLSSLTKRKEDEEVEDDEDAVGVLLGDGTVVYVTTAAWDSIEYHKNEEGDLEAVVVGQFEQFPLNLAWAITIHKSQGQTFENIELDPKCWAPGQLYVALSRLRNIQGLVLLDLIQDNHLVTSPQAAAFYKRILQNQENVQLPANPPLLSLSVSKDHSKEADPAKTDANEEMTEETKEKAKDEETAEMQNKPRKT